MGYAAAHIPFGILVTRYGLKCVMPVSMFLTISGALPIIYSDEWIMPVIGRVCTGMGSSFSPIAAFYLLSTYFPKERFTRLFSVMMAIGLIGAMYAGAPLAYLIESFQCENTLKVLLAIGVVMMIAAYIFLPSEQGKSSLNARDIKNVIFNKKIALIGLAAGLMIGTLEGFPDAWGAAFLSMKYGLSNVQAAKTTSMIFFGMLFGASLCSIAAAYKNQYFQSIAITGVILCTFFSLAIFTPDLSSTTLYIYFFIIGLCCGYQVPALFTGSTFPPKEIASLGSTMVNMIMMSFGHIIHTFVGIAVDMMGGINDVKAVETSLSVIPILCIMGAMLFAYLAKTTKIRLK